MSENTESDHVTTQSHQASEHVFGRNAGRGCAEARGGIDIYMGVSLCVVLCSLRVRALEVVWGDSGHCGWSMLLHLRRRV